MKKPSPASIANSILLLLIFLFVCVSAYVFVSSRDATNVQLLNNLAEDFNEGWYYYDHDGKKIPVTLPTVVKNESRVSRIYHEYIPGFTGSVCFYTHHQAAKFFQNGTVLYEYKMEGNPKWLKSYRSFHHIVDVKPNKKGEICLELTALTDRNTGEFNKMYRGSHSGILYKLLLDRGDKLVLGIILFIVGILVVLLSSLYNPNKGVDKTLMHLALLMLSIGVWQMEESRVLQFLVGSQAVHWILEYIVPYFILFESIVFINDFTTPRTRIFSTILFIIDTFVSFLNLFLQVSGYSSFPVATTVLFILFIIACFYLAYLINLTVKFNRSGTRTFFTISMLASASLFLIVAARTSDEVDAVADMCTSIAFIFVFVSLTLVVYQVSFQKFEHYRQADLYRKLAFVDVNTGVSSRTAWFSLVENWDNEKHTSSPYCLILFDMNNLKKLNDTYGHLTGDKVINAFCSCLKDVFSDSGTIYRIGGDEFICLLRDTDVESVNALLAKFDSLVEAQRVDELSFSVAYGWSMFRPRNKQDFFKAQQKADDRMYERKQLMKQGRDFPAAPDAH